MSGAKQFKPYKGKDIAEGEAVAIRGLWLYAVKNEGVARFLLGDYCAFALGWGSQPLNWDDFTTEEQEALLTTIK